MATLPVEDLRYIATPFARVGIPGSQGSKSNIALDLLAELAQTITEADGAAIALAQEGKVLVGAAAGNTTRQPGARIDKDGSWSDLLLRRTLESIFCVDTEKDSRINTDGSRSMQVRSMIVLPLYGRGSLVAVLEAYWRAPYGFTNREIGSLTRIGELVLRVLKAEGTPAATPRADLQMQNYPRRDESVTAGSGTKPFVPKDLGDLPEREPVLLNPVTSARDERKTFAPAMNRIEVVITPNELEEELTTLPVDHSTEVRIIGSRKRYQWGVIAGLVFVAMLTAGIWWRVEASQAPQCYAAHRQSVVLPQTHTSQGSASADSGRVTSVARATSDSVPPAAKAAAETASPAAQSTPSRITGIHYSSSTLGSTVTLDLEGQPTYQADTASNPTRVFFDLQNTSLSPALSKPILVNDALVARIRSGRSGSATRIVLDVNHDLDFRVQMATNPSRMIVDLRNAPAVK